MKLRLGVRGMMWLTLVIMMWGIISCRTQEEKCLEEVLSLPLANKEELQKVLDHYKDDRGCPKSRIAPFAIVYFGKNQYLTVATNKHYSNG